MTTFFVSSSVIEHAVAFYVVVLSLTIISLSSTPYVVVNAAKTTVSLKDEQRTILRELYDSTNGHAWNENDGWAHNTDDVCTWTGVECKLNTNVVAAGGGEVVAGSNPIIGLNLRNNFLTGRTPPSLWQLSSLKSLDLGYNPSLDVDFSTLTMGQSVTAVPSLEYINIRQTGTTNVNGIDMLNETLTGLILAENKFQSKFLSDLFALRKLTTLSLNGCSLRGTLPDGSADNNGNSGGGISQLSQLREFDIYDNDLTGTLPSGLGRLVHIRNLIISKNQFHGKVPDFVNDDLVLLEQFWASFNDFTGTIPTFDKAPSIQTLYLNGNSFSGDIPATFLAARVIGPEGGGNGQPMKINLSRNRFTGIIPESLDRLAPLEIIWRFGGNQWTDISQALCDNYNWNDGSVTTFGCPGLICPPGRYSAAGYHTVDDPCELCDTADYYGTFDCFDQDDRAVLLDMYATLDGANWKSNDGWSTAPRRVADDDWSGEWMDYCDWYGVDCWDLGDAKDGRVRRLSLANNNLNGIMPETIFSIEHMTTLDVSNNDDLVVSFLNIGRSQHLYSVNVGGTKTKDYDGIQHSQDFFKRLYADNTPIAGTIPSEITRVHELQVLSLQDCDLNGEVPAALFAMSSLRELYLSNNNFQGVLPDRWESLGLLEVLSLAKNSFRGNLPDSFGSAPNLRAISLMDQVTKGGGMTGSVPSYSQSRSLTQLIVGSNKLDGTLPEDLLLAVDPTNSLFHVDFTNNMITGTVHGGYDRFDQMDLFLEGNLISAIADELCNNANWMSGSVKAYGCDAILCPAGTSNYGGRRQYTNDVCTACGENDDGTKYLGQNTCSNLGRGVDLVSTTSTASSGEDSFTGTAGNTAASSSTITEVETASSSESFILELLYDQTSGKSWKASNSWKTETSVCEWYGISCDENGSVASIQLGSNGLKGALPTEIFALPNLVHLKMHGNVLDVDFTGIDNARNLQTLGLDDTGLKSLEGIGKARSLIALNVGYNNLKTDLPEELSKLMNLQTLDISNNKFSGSLPIWIKNIASLNHFAASHNNLSGSILDFASLSKLMYLDLSYNQFEGTVPPALLASSSSNEKIVVDLSHNKITGVVPADLSRLSRLYIQLQENEITGIDESLCTTDGLNDFDVLSFGCDGILCPVGTWNNLGRQSNEDAPCGPCKTAKFMGTTNCGGASSAASENSSVVRAKLAITLLTLSFAFGNVIPWMMM